MEIVCASGPSTCGLDLFHGDKIVNIDQVVASGIKFCFLKATEGLTIVDSTFASRWSGLKTKGLVRGAYHYFHPSLDPLAQAAFFLHNVGPLDAGDLPCVMDWEVSDGIGAMLNIEYGLKFLQLVEKMTRKIPIIYGSPYFLQSLGLDQRFTRYPLWIAEYGVPCPKVPAPWTNWTFWQNSEVWPVPGIGNCDVDYFNGSLEQLQLFAAEQEV